jgi:hypothetical protein
MKRAPLAFMAVWITGWSVGVAFIQSMVVRGDWSTLVFFFTHGGAEILVLTLIARQLVAEATTGSSLPVVELTHDGVTASWTIGDASVFRAVLAGVIGLVAHGLLFGGLAHGLSGGPTLLGGVLAAVAAVAWCVTASLWSRAVWAHLRGGGTVQLEADLDGVRIVEPAGDHHIPLPALQVRTSTDRLQLTGGGTALDLPCVDSPPKQDLVDVLGLMAGKGGDAEPVPVPDALQALRGGHSSSSTSTV